MNAVWEKLGMYKLWIQADQGDSY